MLKATIAFFVLGVNLFAVNPNNIAGDWQSFISTLNNGTQTTEQEYLTLHPNLNFNLVILVSVKKDEAYIKDLRIVISGIWDVKDNTLVYVIKNINVPAAKEVYLISQQSLENLAANFKHKYENDAIHINTIQNLNAKNMSIVSEKGRVSKYSRH